MKNKNKIMIFVFFCVAFLIMRNEVFGQANITNKGDVVCPATGTSIEIAPPRSSRYSYFLNNVTGIAVFIGNQPTGTGALTGTSGLSNSAWRLQPGQAFADSVPNVVSLRLVCMSTTAVAATISFGEAYK